MTDPHPHAMLYTATVEHLRGERYTRTLEIRGHDPEVAFVWSCELAGWKRVGPLSAEPVPPPPINSSP